MIAQNPAITYKDIRAPWFMSELCHLSILKYASSHGIDIISDPGIAKIPGDMGRLSLIKYLISQGMDKAALIPVFRMASGNGRLQILKYVKSQGVNISKDEINYCLEMASQDGHRDIRRTANIYILKRLSI